MDKKKLVVLVADGDLDSLRDTVAIVKEGGYQVLEAGSGRECLDKFEKESLDLVLLDGGLSDLDSRRVCREIRRDSASELVFIIVILNDSVDSSASAEWLQAGADGLVHRPYDREELLARLRIKARAKQVELDLISNNERIESILQNIHTGTVIVDPDSLEILYANRAAARMIGMSEKDLLGRPCKDNLCSDEREGCPVLTGDKRFDNSRAEIRRADGTTLEVLKTVVPISYSGKSCLLDCFVDISGQQRAERQALERVDMMRAMMRSVRDGIVIIPKNTVIPPGTVI